MCSTNGACGSGSDRHAMSAAGESELNADIGFLAESDPDVWSGRALQEVSSSCRIAVLHQCIRPLIGACCTPGHHGYQRACDLISGQALIGPRGSPVFACAGKTDPPSLRFLSQTSAGKRIKLSHRMLLISSVPLFVPRAVPSSRPAHRRCVARRSGQGRPSL